MNKNLQPTALKYIEAGYSVIPVVGKKALVSWKQYRDRTPTQEEVKQWFDSFDPTGLALIASDRMTIYDFDDQETWDRFQTQAGDLLDGIPIQKSGKGMHIAFLSDHTFPTCHLAERPNPQDSRDPDILIETRNAGHYIVLAPSVHYNNDGKPSGKHYEAIQGHFYDLPEIDAARAKETESLARSYDEMPVVQKASEATLGKEISDTSNRTRDLFNEAFDLHDILIRNEYEQNPGNENLYRRPNSTSGSYGIEIQPDGTLFSNHGDALNTHSDDGTKHKHDAFDTFRILEHGGDYRNAYTAAEDELGIGLMINVSKSANGGKPITSGLPRLIDIDLLATDLPELEFIIPEYLPEGLFILAGKPKLGKSWLALDMCIAVATGGTVLDKQVDQGEAVYFGLEDGKRRLKDRMQKLGLKDKMPPGLHLGEMGALDPLDKGGYKQLDAMLTQFPDCRLVVIDTLGKVKPSVSNKDAYEFDVKILSELQKIVAAHSICMMLVTHTRKADAEDTYDKVLGSVGLTGTVDGTLLLDRKRNQREATLYITGRDIEEQELAVEFDKITFKWHILGEAWKVKADGDQLKIMGVLDDADGPLSPKEIADSTGKSVAAIKSMLITMQKKDLVTKEGHGKYVIKSNPLTVKIPTDAKSGNKKPEEDPNQLPLDV